MVEPWRVRRDRSEIVTLSMCQLDIAGISSPDDPVFYYIRERNNNAQFAGHADTPPGPWICPV
jgi:hypothetical protein